MAEGEGARMTGLQRKFVESRVLLAALVVAVMWLQEDALLARSAFALAAVYGLLNWRALTEIERRGPRVIDVLAASRAARYWLVGFFAAEAFLAWYFLFSGRDLGDHLGGFGPMFLAFFLPLAPAVWMHQGAQFVALRNAP